jgi:hypothetical protein
VSTTGKHHHELNEQGEGKCSVPMWYGWGGDAGFCDERAFGPQTKEYLAGFRYMNPQYNRPAYAPGLACPVHGGPKVRVCMDGNMHCAVRPEFVNLQESPAGFGATREEAIAALVADEQVSR